MSYTNGLDKPSDYFNTVLYTGNGTAIGSGGNAITGVGFQPDWLWIKNRSNTTVHHLQDVVRGSTKALYSNLTNAEGTSTENVNSFDSDGFTVGSGTGVNTNAENFVAWNWLASNTTASNTDGSITSTVSANTTSGFSIVSYTGNGTAGATVGHGLGATPSFYILKSRSTANTWYTYNKITGATKTLPLNTSDAELSSSFANSTEPTSSVFSLGSASAFNGNGDTFIAYCFAEKKGFSKFGKYTGNGSADGTFVYTGFKPAFVLIKNTTANELWEMFDNKRIGYNPKNNRIYANANNAEDTSAERLDLLSNGFKIRTTGSHVNENATTIIYMAFAENPFVTSTSIPCTAR